MANKQKELYRDGTALFWGKERFKVRQEILVFRLRRLFHHGMNL